MKRLRLTFIVFIFLPITFIAQQQHHINWPSLADSPWPVLRGDMQATGRSKFVGPKTNNIIWRKDMPLGIFEGPVIGYEDILFVGTRASSGDSVNYFYALDKNGNDIWTFETKLKYSNWGSPLVRKDGGVYFFSQNSNAYSLDKNGKLNWSFYLPNFRISYGVAKNGDLYVPKTDTILIISSNGILKKKIFCPNNSNNIVFSAGGDTIFYTSNNSTSKQYSSLNAADLAGNILWSHKFEHTNNAPPVVDNYNKIFLFARDTSYIIDTLYVNESYLYSLNPEGTVNWKYPIGPFNLYSAPTIDNNGNIVFFASKVVNQAYRYCIVSLSYEGKENWINYFADDESRFMMDQGMVCDAEGKVYCGSTLGGYFYCFDKDGNLLWKLDLGDLEYDSCPAIGSDGTLYIGTHISSLFPYHTQNLIAIKDKPDDVEEINKPVDKFNLSQNYPNPFNPVTTIKYSIPNESLVKIKIYDILGREVAALVNEQKTVGNYTVEFNGNDLASGVYFYQIKASGFTQTKKMILMR